MRDALRGVVRHPPVVRQIRGQVLCRRHEFARRTRAHHAIDLIVVERVAGIGETADETTRRTRHNERRIGRIGGIAASLILENEDIAEILFRDRVQLHAMCDVSVDIDVYIHVTNHDRQMEELADGHVGQLTVRIPVAHLIHIDNQRVIVVAHEDTWAHQRLVARRSLVEDVSEAIVVALECRLVNEKEAAVRELEARGSIHRRINRVRTRHTRILANDLHSVIQIRQELRRRLRIRINYFHYILAGAEYRNREPEQYKELDELRDRRCSQCVFIYIRQ